MKGARVFLFYFLTLMTLLYFACAFVTFDWWLGSKLGRIGYALLDGLICGLLALAATAYVMDGPVDD